MSAETKIEWVRNEDGSQGRTWNPVTGCTKVSPGCDHCYAETIAERFRGGPAFPNGFDVQLRPNKLHGPLKWRQPSMVFVNSMSDLFHDSVPEDYIAEVFAVMAAAPQHTFQLLTKRHARMRSLLSSDDFRAAVDGWALDQHGQLHVPWPLPNVWLGVSTETQQWADIRIPALLDTPAAIRFISAEPLLGEVDIFRSALIDRDPGVDWVIAGGESGRSARPMHPEWVRSLRNQCQDAGVPFFFKQAGSVLSREWECTGKGDIPSEWPELFPREFPNDA